MFDEYLAAAGGLSRHWVLVISVVLVFFFIQFGLSVRLYVRARRQDRLLGRLLGELKRGGDGRPGDLAWDFDWLGWVLDVFPSETTTPSRNFTRDEALHELDSRMGSDASYLLLQRMGIMAPLLGVVLTVVGFFWLKVDATDEQSLQSILVTVMPLVSGVGAGAVLALLNQALLQGVGGRLEHLRVSARTWFDAAIWRHAGQNAQAATVTAQAANVAALAAIDRFINTIAQSTGQHAESSQRIEAAAALMEQAALQLKNTVRTFQGEISEMPPSLGMLREAIAASAKALEELLPVGARAVANLDVSVAAFRTTIDREFTDAAHLQYRSSQSLAECTRHIIDSADHLQRIVDRNVAPAQHDGAARLPAGASDPLSRFVEHDLAAAQAMVRLHETLNGLDGTLESISKLAPGSGADIDRLIEALARATQIADAIPTLPEQIRGRLEHLSARCSELAAASQHTR